MRKEVLVDRVVESNENVIREEQCGTRKKTYSDQIIFIRQLCEKMKEKKLVVFLAFMNLEKTNDRVDKEAMWQVLAIYVHSRTKGFDRHKDFL